MSWILSAVDGTGWPPPRRTTRRKLSNAMWGGSRFYTNRAIEAVSRSIPITSRKRRSPFGNPRSDHYILNTGADAVDRGVGNSRSNAVKVARATGHPDPENVRDFGTWVTRRNGKAYQHQLIWSTHGTGPHLHYGVHRI
jgi:hypothetical protein